MKRPLSILATVAVLAVPAAAIADGNGKGKGSGKGQEQSAKAPGRSGEAPGHKKNRGNACGRGHAKKVKGVKGGLKIGKTCVKKNKPKPAEGPTGATGATGPTA